MMKPMGLEPHGSLVLCRNSYEYHLRMKLMRRLKQEKMTQKIASF